jgi:hypothetical protein
MHSTFNAQSKKYMMNLKYMKKIYNDMCMYYKKKELKKEKGN